MIGPRLPLITDIRTFHPTFHDPTKDILFKVRLLPAGSINEENFYPAEKLISSFGRPWTVWMMAVYSSHIAHIAVDPTNSSHGYCKNQLLEMASFARKNRFRLEDVFGKAMKEIDPKAKRSDQVLGPKLQKLLGLTNRTPIPVKAEPKTARRPSPSKTKKKPQQQFLDFRTKDLESLTKRPPETENRSHLRKVQAILDRDDSILDLIKKGGLKGLSLRKRNSKKEQKQHQRPSNFLGQRKDELDHQEEDADSQKDSIEQCQRLHYYSKDQKLNESESSHN